MQVEPTRLAGLAASSESILGSMVKDWAGALDDLSSACSTLGDATGAADVSSSYADSLTAAGEVVSSLAEALGLGLAGLVDAARDAVRADDAVADELEWTAHQLGDGGFGRMPGDGGR